MTVSLLHQKKSLTMKKLFTNTNPFILLLAPVMFALIMSISYQFEQKKNQIEHAAASTVHATSLFVKGVSILKGVVAVSKQDVW
jgi:hypothetical protein